MNGQREIKCSLKDAYLARLRSTVVGKSTAFDECVALACDDVHRYQKLAKCLKRLGG